jgi:hypothetical protein
VHLSVDELACTLMNWPMGGSALLILGMANFCRGI